MILPELPKPILSLPEGKYTFQVESQHIHREHFYTEAQVLKLQRDTVEACAALCHELANAENSYDYVAGAEWCEARILSMLKEETE